MKLALLICIIISLDVPSACLKFCKEFEGRVEHKFYPLRHCQRSNKTAIAFSTAESADECAEFARFHLGLAFNFSPQSRQKKNLFDVKSDSKSEPDEFYNCEVIECPEYRNYSSIVNDTRFDYYSLYARPPPSENATCVPSVGMFTLIKERSNYSVAYNVCTSLGGSLAHVASEIRNVKLSSLLRASTNSSSKERTAYVGLNETKLGEFFTSNNEPLSCFDFRAWSPGHPPDVRKPGCVAITPESSWKVFNCNRKLMYICEILTSGPNPNVNNLKQKCSVKAPNNRIMPRKTFPT